MAITDDVRKYGETVLEQGKVALEEARKPWYAAVGAGELAFDRLQSQFTQLPADVQARLRKLQDTQLDRDAVKDALGSAAGHAVGAYGTAATQAREAAAQARETYESLAHRGELAVRRLRRSDEVSSAFDKVEDVVADAGDAVATAETKVTKPGRPTTRPTAAAQTRSANAVAGTRTAKKTTPAKKAPAKRTPKN